MAQRAKRGLLSLVPHPLHHHPPTPTQRGASESGVQSAEGGRGNRSPSGRGLRRWRAAAAVAVGGRVGAIPHSSWEEGPGPVGQPGLSQSEAPLQALGPRRPRAPPLPVWVLCPPPPAPGLLLAWPSLGVCHTGSHLRPAPRKTEGRVGPLGGDPSGQRDAGSWWGGELRVGDAASPQEGGGTAPGPGGGFDLERQFPQSSCLPAPRVWIQACHVQRPLGCMTCAVSPSSYSWPLWNLLSNTSVRCVRSLVPEQLRGNVGLRPGGLRPTRSRCSKPRAPSDHWPQCILWAHLLSSHLVTSGHGESEQLEEPFLGDPQGAGSPVLSFLPPWVQPSDPGSTYLPGSSPGNPHRPQDGTRGEGDKLSQAEVCKPDLAMALAGTCQPPAQRGPPHLSKHLRHKLSQKRGGVYT